MDTKHVMYLYWRDLFKEETVFPIQLRNFDYLLDKASYVVKEARQAVEVILAANTDLSEALKYPITLSR